MSSAHMPTPVRRRGKRTRGVRPALDRLEPRVVPASFVVDWFADQPDVQPGDGLAQTADGHTTLRAAVMEANALGGSHEILVPAGHYALAASLSVTAAVAIHGGGVGRTVVTGGGTNRLFAFPAAGESSLSDMTLSGGRADEGGAVRLGGAARVQLIRIDFTDNQASVGGALAIDGEDAVAVVTESTFRDNRATDAGGAVYADGRGLRVTTSAFVGNTAPDGAALAIVAGEASVSETTFSGNAAIESGGAVLVDGHGRLRLLSDTITRNTAARGSALAVVGGEVYVANTILAGNTGADVLGSYVDGGTNFVGGDPKLSDLGRHGGATDNHVPLPGSPVLDAGADEDGFDQRRLPRTGRADIGAIEARAFAVANLSGVLALRVGDIASPLRIRITEGGDGLAGVPVTFAPPTAGAGGSFAGPATVVTDADGVATAPTFQANGITGTYRIRASIAGSLGIDIDAANAPGPATAFELSAPASVREGEAFTVTLRAFDAFGNPASDFTGTVELTSGDDRADPVSVTFTEADAGVATATVTLRTPGRQTLTATAGSAGGTADIEVANVGPSAVTLDSVAPLNEGGTATLTGHIDNIDDRDTHTVVIDWADGSAPVEFRLAAGETNFTRTHRYDNDLTGRIRVTVTDAGGASRETTAAVTVRNVVPVIAPTIDANAFLNAGEELSVNGRFTDPGSDDWTVTVDYGDGTTPQTVRLVDSRDFHVEHVYSSEGTFTVVINVMDDDGAAVPMRERVLVLPPGASNVKTIVVPPGETATLTNGDETLRAEFFNASSGRATLLAGIVSLDALARIAENAPTTADGSTVRAFEMRGLDIGAGSRMTVTFKYDPNADEQPVLMFRNPLTRLLERVQGSQTLPNSYVVDAVNHTVTVIFDSTSNPRPRDLNGTLFTLSVPAPPPPPAATQQPSPAPALALGPNLASSPVSDVPAFSAHVGTPTTSLLTNREVTLTLASSDSLRRGGSDSEGNVSGPQLPPAIGFLHNLYEVREILVEAFRMWIDQPAPVIAPADPTPPQPPAADQIKLDEVPAAQAHIAGAATARTVVEPWWLEQRVIIAADADVVEDVAAADAPIPVTAREPSESERAAAAVMGLWVGATALASVAPGPKREETEEDEAERGKRAPKRRWRTGGLDEVGR